MSQTPKLSFSNQEISGKAMLVEEVDLPLADGQPVAPFNSLRMLIPPGGCSTVDIHDSKECWFIASGNGVIIYNGETRLDIKPGDVLFYDSRRSHQVFNHGDEDILLFSIWWR
jgi:mannose-6-phosphate isomerase-like protein (cupin superfamily)